MWFAKVASHPLTTTLDPASTMDTIIPTIEKFRSVFTAPTFCNFRFLIVAWLKCGQATVSSMLRLAGRLAELFPQRGGEPKHFSVFYRFFTRAQWSLDELGHVLARAFESHLPDGKVVALVDDTIFRRTGPRILGGGVHHDPLASTYSGKRGRTNQFCFGLRFVVVAIWVPVGFMRAGGVAIPVLFRLYRTPRSCSADEHTKFTVLGARLLQIIEGWWPDRQIVVVGDRDYACSTVIERLDTDTEMVGRLPMDAALYDPDFEQTKLGRPRKWGDRLPSPVELAEDCCPWKLRRLYIYGRQVTLMVKTMQAQWKPAGADRPLTIVLTRDPSGRLDDACFFRTRDDCSAKDVLVPASQRWSLESCFRDCKQHLGLEAVQNGFARGETRADTNQPGPQPEPGRSPTASRRTVPVGMYAYAIVILWYLNHGRPLMDITRARSIAPWYTHKATISFGDMLQAFRRQLDIEDLIETPAEGRLGEKRSSQSATGSSTGPFGPHPTGRNDQHRRCG